MTDAHVDRGLRAAVYAVTVRTGAVPQEAELHEQLGMPAASIRASILRLADQHKLTLEPGTSRIWMAHPFSAIPTAFKVIANGIEYFANCAWDVFGIAALLEADVTVHAACGDCGEGLDFSVRNGVISQRDMFVHFLVPPRRFYDDIGFT